MEEPHKVNHEQIQQEACEIKLQVKEDNVQKGVAVCAGRRRGRIRKEGEDVDMLELRKKFKKHLEKKAFE